MPDRPLRADAQRNRAKILRAAEEAFAASGYGVPLDDIAALAGVGPGTVYRHFPTKEALFEAVVTARVGNLIDDARARAGAADPGQAFFAFLARIAQEAAAKRDLPDAIAITGALQDNLYSALDVLLRRAQKAGAVRADISTADLIVLLKGLIRSIQDASPGASPHLSDLMFAVVGDGLRRPGTFPGPGSGHGPRLTTSRPGIAVLQAARLERGSIMSEQASGTHGPREDDAIKRQDRSELEAHGDQWPEPDSDDDDSADQDTTWAPEGRFAGTLPGEDWAAIDLRSDLARHLDRTAFPATRAHLLETLEAHQADQRLLDRVSSLPKGTTVTSLAELLRALGIPVEERPA